MGNDPLFVNKVAAAVLSAGLLAMVAGFISDLIYHPAPLAKPGFVIAATDSGGGPTQTAAAAAPSEPIEVLLASANVENGQKVAKKCVSCHTFVKGGANKIGPNLWDIVGAKPAAADGFGYSSAMRGMEQAWDYDALNKFILKPRDFLRGTKMSFAGIRKDKDRADLIAYLRSLSDNPKPLP